MDLFDVVRSCARRWYICIPLLAVVGWFSYSAYNSVTTMYYSNAVIGLSPPSTRIDNAIQGVPVPRNGLLDVGGASMIANMTSIGLQQPSVVERVVAAGGQPNYVAKMFPVSPSMQQLPLVMIEATENNPVAATATLEIVLKQAEGTLQTLQQHAQVPDDQMVKTFVVSPPSAPVAVVPSRTRSTVAIFVAGAGLTVLFTVLADVLLTRFQARRRRRQARGDIESTPSDLPTTGRKPNQTNSAPEDALGAR